MRLGKSSIIVGGEFNDINNDTVLISDPIVSQTTAILSLEPVEFYFPRDPLVPDIPPLVLVIDFLMARATTTLITDHPESGNILDSDKDFWTENAGRLNFGRLYRLSKLFTYKQCFVCLR